MLYIFDIDGTLIEGFITTTTCENCKGEGRTARPKTADHILTDSEPWERCAPCKGKGYLFNDHLPYEVVTVLPGRREKIAELAEDDQTYFALATNQGGVALGHQQEEEVYKKLGKVVTAFKAFHSRPLSVHACFFHPKAEDEKWRDPDGTYRRKPNPGMIEDAMFGHFGDGWDEMGDHTVYVGDLATDREAAEAAGVKFAWAWDFFGTEAPNGD